MVKKAEKKAPTVPESVLKRRKRDEDWAAKKAATATDAKKKARDSRKDIFKRAESYVKEYRDQVSMPRSAPALLISCAALCYQPSGLNTYVSNAFIAATH